MNFMFLKENNFLKQVFLIAFLIITQISFASESFTFKHSFSDISHSNSSSMFDIPFAISPKTERLNKVLQKDQLKLSNINKLIIEKIPPVIYDEMMLNVSIKDICSKENSNKIIKESILRKIYDYSLEPTDVETKNSFYFLAREFSDSSNETSWFYTIDKQKKILYQRLVKIPLDSQITLRIDSLQRKSFEFRQLNLRVKNEAGESIVVPYPLLKKNVDTFGNLELSLPEKFIDDGSYISELIIFTEQSVLSKEKFNISVFNTKNQIYDDPITLSRDNSYQSKSARLSYTFFSRTGIDEECFELEDLYFTTTPGLEKIINRRNFPAQFKLKSSKSKLPMSLDIYKYFNNKYKLIDSSPVLNKNASYTVHSPFFTSRFENLKRLFYLDEYDQNYFNLKIENIEIPERKKDLNFHFLTNFKFEKGYLITFNKNDERKYKTFFEGENITIKDNISSISILVTIPKEDFEKTQKNPKTQINPEATVVFLQKDILSLEQMLEDNNLPIALTRYLNNVNFDEDEIYRHMNQFYIKQNNANLSFSLDNNSESIRYISMKFDEYTYNFLPSENNCFGTIRAKYKAQNKSFPICLDSNGFFRINFDDFLSPGETVSKVDFEVNLLIPKNHEYLPKLSITYDVVKKYNALNLFRDAFEYIYPELNVIKVDFDAKDLLIETEPRNSKEFHRSILGSRNSSANYMAIPFVRALDIISPHFKIKKKYNVETITRLANFWFEIGSYIFLMIILLTLYKFSSKAMSFLLKIFFTSAFAFILVTRLSDLSYLANIVTSNFNLYLSEFLSISLAFSLLGLFESLIQKKNLSDIFDEHMVLFGSIIGMALLDIHFVIGFLSASILIFVIFLFFRSFYKNISN